MTNSLPTNQHTTISTAFTEDGFMIPRLAASNVGATFLILVLLIRIYSGWSYVGSRLTSKVVEFEETGWYDGDFEIKSESERKRDKFLYMDKVQPVVKRLQVFTGITAGLALASIIAYNVSLQYQPVFEQYDPQLLERMSYDETLAEKAAQSSGGRPIYCDNRYYRAVAGGGQGCR
jgi:Conserved in the green lineage and diatoms 27